jgi:hypothetical protein
MCLRRRPVEAGNVSWSGGRMGATESGTLGVIRYKDSLMTSNDSFSEHQLQQRTTSKRTLQSNSLQDS